MEAGIRAADRGDRGQWQRRRLSLRPRPISRTRALLINREVSWIAFNDRVLQLAEDESIPLLERLKYCAIWESNLDEFFMVRVADLHDQVAASLPAGADGMTPLEQIEGIRELAIYQRDRIESCFARELKPGSRSRESGSSATRRPTPKSAARSTTSSSARSSRR